MLDVARLLEEDFITLPDISISINPDTYLFGDTVTLTAVGIDGMPGERSWFDRLEANVIENHTDVITLKASYTNKNWDIYFRFGGYYGQKTIGPIRLSPGELDLRLTNGFELSYEVAEGPSLQVSSDYLGLNWNHGQCENYISSDGIHWHHLSRLIHPETVCTTLIPSWDGFTRRVCFTRTCISMPREAGCTI